MKKIIWIGIIILIIVATVIVTTILIKRNKIDYYIPGLDEYNSGENYDDEMDFSNFEEDTFDEEEIGGFDYSKVKKVYKGKLKEAQEIYNKVSLGDSMQEVIDKLGEPDEIQKDEEDTNFVSISYVSPSGEYDVNFCLENDSVYEKNLFLLSSVKNDLFLSSELQTNIDDMNPLVAKVKEGMSLEEIIKILGDKYYEVREDFESGKWLSWCDKLENELSIAFYGGEVVDIAY